MRIIYLLFLALFIYGCGGSAIDPLNMAKDTLTNSSWYISDSCIDEYAKYEFGDNSYEKTIYKTQNLDSIDKKISDKVEYTTTLQVAIYEGSEIFDCTVTNKDQNGSVSLVCLKRGSVGYSVIKTLWDDKNKAIDNTNTNCQ